MVNTPGGAPQASCEAPSPAVARSSDSCTRNDPTATSTDGSIPPRERWQSPGDRGSRAQAASSTSLNGRMTSTGTCPRDGHRPHPHPTEAPGYQGTVAKRRRARPARIPRMGATQERAGPSNSSRVSASARTLTTDSHFNGKPMDLAGRTGGCPKCYQPPSPWLSGNQGSRGPTPGGHQEGAGPMPGAQERHQRPSVGPRMLEQPKEYPYTPGNTSACATYHESKPPCRPRTRTALSTTSPQRAKISTRGAAQGPDGPGPMDARRCPERFRLCKRLEPLLHTMAGGRAQELALDFLRSPGRGIFPRAPRRPCRTEGCGSQGRGLRKKTKVGFQPIPGGCVESVGPSPSPFPSVLCCPLANPSCALSPPRAFPADLGCWRKPCTGGGQGHGGCRCSIPSMTAEDPGIDPAHRLFFVFYKPKPGVLPHSSRGSARHGVVGHGRAGHGNPGGRRIRPGEGSGTRPATRPRRPPSEGG